jgi:predicted nucleic acid-binding protein
LRTSGQIAMPDRTRVVLDAAALIDLLHDQTGVGARLEGLRFTAPALIFPEAASAFRKGELRGTLDARESRALFEAMLRVPLDIVDWRPGAQRVWELRHAVTPYDASYVALAELLAVPLVTADRRLANAPGIRCDVIVV